MIGEGKIGEAKTGTVTRPAISAFNRYQNGLLIDSPDVSGNGYLANSGRQPGDFPGGGAFVKDTF